MPNQEINHRLSLGDVRKVITSLGMALPLEVHFKALADDERFYQGVSLLLGANAGAKEQEEAQSYIKGTVSCINSQVYEDLVHCGFKERPGFSVLTKIGRTQGDKFRNTLSRVARAEWTQEDVAYLEQVLGQSSTYPKGSSNAARAPSRTKLSDDREGIEPEYASFTVFSKDYALCFNASRTKQGLHTITADAAKKANEQVDWKNKVIIQLTERELPEFYAVLKGYDKRIEMTNHGAKSMYAEWQKGKIFMNVTTKGFSAGVPAVSGDIVQLVALCMRQLRLNFPFLTAFEIDRMIFDNAKAVQASMSNVASEAK